MNFSLCRFLGLSFVVARVFFAADINPWQMPRVGTVDERFQSFNIEMVEVTGGRAFGRHTRKPRSPTMRLPRLRLYLALMLQPFGSVHRLI